MELPKTAADLGGHRLLNFSMQFFIISGKNDRLVTKILKRFSYTFYQKGMFAILHDIRGKRSSHTLTKLFRTSGYVNFVHKQWLLNI